MFSISDPFSDRFTDSCIAGTSKNLIVISTVINTQLEKITLERYLLPFDKNLL